MSNYFILATTLCSLVLESTSITAAAPKLSNLLFILFNVDKYLMNVFAFCSKLNDLKRHFVIFKKKTSEMRYLRRPLCMYV